MFLISESGEVVYFTDYILSESVLPKQTEYGTDYENGWWMQSGTLRWTYFLNDDKDRAYGVLISNTGNVSFGYFKNSVPTPDELEANITNSVKLSKHINFERIDANGALPIFNKVFYIIMKGVEKFHYNRITFSGQDGRLSLMYKRLMRNKPFINYLKDKGFTYEPDETEQELFTFTRNWK